jgi:hypothetical protein
MDSFFLGKNKVRKRDIGRHKEPNNVRVSAGMGSYIRGKSFIFTSQEHISQVQKYLASKEQLIAGIWVKAQCHECLALASVRYRLHRCR